MPSLLEQYTILPIHASPRHALTLSIQSHISLRCTTLWQWLEYVWLDCATEYRCNLRVIDASQLDGWGKDACNAGLPGLGKAHSHRRCHKLPVPKTQQHSNLYRLHQGTKAHIRHSRHCKRLTTSSDFGAESPFCPCRGIFCLASRSRCASSPQVQTSKYARLLTFLV